MGSMGNSNPNLNPNPNPNPWTPKDCSEGICSIYCPQWCYKVYSPPPPILLGDGDDDPSGFEFSPLIVAVIGILASTFILVTYYTIISRLCRQRHNTNDPTEDDGNSELARVSSSANSGLDEALIKSITVCKYNKRGGLVEGHDCSVCLSEFEENEDLRLLPKCNHAFHLPCIDTWLKSHATCPLCRASVTACPNPNSSMEPPPRVIVNALEHQQRSNHVVVVVESSEEQEKVVSFDAHTLSDGEGYHT